MLSTSMAPAAGELADHERIRPLIFSNRVSGLAANRVSTVSSPSFFRVMVRPLCGVSSWRNKSRIRSDQELTDSLGRALSISLRHCSQSSVSMAFFSAIPAAADFGVSARRSAMERNAFCAPLFSPAE
ncbi:MAG TPA: hypothetical protein VFP33_08390, partial [Gallionella sp.]|nr:hypothetical protein [Gallionella sp.]